MDIDLSIRDIEVLLTSIEYSKLNIREAQGTPYSVRQENLTRLDVVATKLRKSKRSANINMQL